MAKKRRKVFLLETAEHLRTASTPAVIEIIQALRHTGSSSVRELGVAIGRNPNSLHYHIRRLIKLGMIHKVGSRRSGARTEAIYDVTADAFIGADVLKKKSLQKPTSDGVGSLLRLAKRNWDKACDNPDLISHDKDSRNMRVHRLTARLNERQLKKINDYIKKIDDVFIENIGSSDGQMTALTMVLSPLNTANKDNNNTR